MTQIHYKVRSVLPVLQLALLEAAQIRIIELEIPVMTLMLFLVLILESASANQDIMTPTPEMFNSALLVIMHETDEPAQALQIAQIEQQAIILI